MIFIIYANAGFGHKKAAEAIEDGFKKKSSSVETKLIDILEFTPKWFSYTYSGSYRFLATKMPWLWGAGFHVCDFRPLFYLIFFFRKIINRMLLGSFIRYVEKFNPDTLIFTHFLGIHTSAMLVKKKKLSAKIYVSVTDFFAHSFWIDYDVDGYFVMDKHSKVEMVDKWKIAPVKVFPHGIPISSKFSVNHRPKEDVDLSTRPLRILFSSGSFGHGPIIQTLNFLNPFKNKIEVTVVCGNNKKAKETLSKVSFQFPVKVFGFVDNMDELMSQTDLLIAKPGGITTCEALSQKVPMIISSYIPGQEEGNLRILEEYEVCWRLKKPGDIQRIISEVLTNTEDLENKRKIMNALAKPNATSDIIDHITRER